MQPANLCEAIRYKCATQHWYGPGWPLPPTEDDPRRFGFEFPPLTEEQVSQAEAALGFSLPPALRVLYIRLANGGFGPHRGFLRLTGKPSVNDRTVIERYQEYRERCTFFGLENQVQPGKGCIFPDSYWPRFILPICNKGCGDYICLDAKTGNILIFEIWDAHEYSLAYVADSLEHWLQAWLFAPDNITER